MTFSPLHAVSASYIIMCIAIQDCSCWGSMNPPTPIPPCFPIFHFPFPIPTISSEAILFSHSHFGFAHINFSIWNCILHTLYDYCSLLTFDCRTPTHYICWELSVLNVETRKNQNDDRDDVYNTDGYIQLSKHVMAKHKVAISCSRDHIPREMEGSCDKLNIERLVNSCTPNRKMLIVSRLLSFTTACTIPVRSGCISSNTSNGAQIGKGKESKQ